MAEYVTKLDVIAILTGYARGCVDTDRAFDLVDDTLEICREIENLPARDVAPVKHGEWLATTDENKKKCSECKVIHLIAQYPTGQANYCPNCGAIMEV